MGWGCKFFSGRVPGWSVVWDVRECAGTGLVEDHHCGHDAAWEILVRAASTRNVKLRDVAAAVEAFVSKDRLPAHFDT